MSEYPDGEDPGQNQSQAIEQLTADTRKNSQLLIDTFGEMLVRKLFSKTWQLRDEALADIEDEVINQNKHRADEAFVSSIGAVNFTISDKMAGVA